MPVALHQISTVKTIERKIHLIRDKRVMLSDDLAPLYRVEPRALLQAVKRNPKRFPKDFMFQVSVADHANLKSQTVISSWGGSRSRPYAFTQEGIAMLSSVLHSPRAVQVNVAIMRAFVNMREVLSTHDDLLKKINAMEKTYDEQFQVVFSAIKKVMVQPSPPKRRIGFLISKDPNEKDPEKNDR